MATLTRLASTLTAKYFPSQTLTDAFYIDGRLFGKREARQADITIDKEERGFFFSVFSHPTIPEYEIGTLPPYEPQLRATCNDVKFGRKEIDGMIEGFLATAVDVTGKMKLNDNNDRAPYFSGVIVRDAEAFAVTIGTGLAFLYRDDTLFPLTDAGIPMEPIDANGNRVGDFLYYCSSKTANALWSNIFSLSPDDCIILCNKEIYDALGQREILRILNDAEDQCDAAGVIITQASARMPNVPMQFSISFVESVVSDEKKGLFGFKKKAKEEDMSDMSIKSTFEGGLVGAAAEAAADAGFAQGLQMTKAATESSLFFGDTSNVSAPITNQPASSDKGIEVKPAGDTQNSPIEFLDTSINKEPAVEMSAEEMMMNLFGMSRSSTPKETPAPENTDEKESSSPFVSSFVIPSASEEKIEEKEEDVKTVIEETKSDDSEVEMKTISTTEFKIEEDEDNSKTKPILSLETSIIKSLMSDAEKKKEEVDAIPVIEDTTEEKAAEEVVSVPEVQIIPEVKFDIEDAEVVPKEATTEEVSTNPAGEIVFSESSDSGFFNIGNPASATDAFDPYSVGASEEMKNSAELVFGDDGFAATPAPEAFEENQKADNIPVPEFEIKAEKPELKDDDKLKVDFPETTEIKEEVEEKKSEDDSFSLPFENEVGVFSDDTKPAKQEDDIPDMPLFGANSYETPVVATNSEQPVNAVDDNVYSYGQYVENENMDSNPAQYPEENSQPAYQSFGAEGYAYTSPEVNMGYDNGYQYEPGQYTPDSVPAANAEPSVETNPENDWINSILGIDDDMDTGYQQSSPVSDNGGETMSNNSYTYPNQRPVSNPQQRRPQGNSYRPQSGGAGNGRGGRKVPKLNRNGYIFIAFVLVCLIILIILISLIFKACGKKDKAVTETSNETGVESVVNSETSATLPTAQPQSNPDQMGMFYFGSPEGTPLVGFMNMYDLANKAYNIGYDQIGTDTMTQTINAVIIYNKLDPATYSPSIGDILILPTTEVIARINAGETITYDGQAAPADTAGVVTGEVSTVEGGADQQTPEA